MMRFPAVLGLVVLLGGCGSVAVPEENLYRLALPDPSGGEQPRAGVLRVGAFPLASNLSPDVVLVASGPVRMTPFELHRWVAPLDGMIADTLALGLARTHCFAEVKAALEPGPADLRLHGRVVDFQIEARARGWVAVVGIRATLVAADGERTVFHDGFRSEVPAAADTPEAGVRALSVGLGQVVDMLVERMMAEGVFDPLVDAVPGRG